MSKTLYAVTKGRRIEFVNEDTFEIFNKLNVPQYQFSFGENIVEMWDANDNYFKVCHETLIDFEELLEKSSDYYWRDSVAFKLWNEAKDCTEVHVAILLHR